jgi:hypothetical protein
LVAHLRRDDHDGPVTVQGDRDAGRAALDEVDDDVHLVVLAGLRSLFA